MPELPDVTIYVEALESRIVGETLLKVRLKSPFLVRSVDPPVFSVEGKEVTGVRRKGKRIVIALSDDFFLVFHLMIAGRFRWHEREPKDAGKIGLARFEFTSGCLLLTEAGSKKRASLHVARGEEEAASHDPGGVEVMESCLDTFKTALRRENHTLKRALTDPRLFSGIGNAYSDEILHSARLSPIKLTQTLIDQEIERLHQAAVEQLTSWTDRLRTDFAGRFPGPGEITAFREGFAVHGRYGTPCPDCGTQVQRIRYAENETNYCPTCQTDGRLLADRALSRLLKKDWPKSIEEFEERYGVI